MPHDRTLAEARVVAPLAMAGFSAGAFSFSGMVDLEAWTVDHGQLTPGAWGEGFIDRRHPHTFFHQLMASWTHNTGGVRASVSAGKGFAPFGTDDPMSRPVLLYPVNHHWSQVLERAVVVAGLASHQGALEFGVFNGDEPAGPWSWPKLGRFGDSWSARAVFWPDTSWEVQLSHASVRSPERRDPPYGPRNDKWSASARRSVSRGAARNYALVEIARTSESFAYYSLLAELENVRGAARSYGRLEISTRPEPFRLADPFRYASPDSLAGASIWYVFTGGWGHALRAGAIRIEPVAEYSLAYVAGIRGAFSPPGLYGSGKLWSLTLGVRLGAGMPMHRMGRYGVHAEPMAMPAHAMPGMKM